MKPARAAEASTCGGPRAVLSPREASIFACFCDAVVAPEPLLPAVRDTDAVPAFERLLAASPKLNAAGLRALLYAVELAPCLTGAGTRLRRLDRTDRARFVERAASARLAPVRELAKALRSVAFLSYYGDVGVMRTFGYDPDERVRRGRELRGIGRLRVRLPDRCEAAHRADLCPTSMGRRRDHLDRHARRASPPPRKAGQRGRGPHRRRRPPHGRG